MQVGDKRRFNFEKGKEFEIKEIINDAELPLDWTWDIWEGHCPKCKEYIKVSSTKNYTVDKVEVLEAPDGQRILMGFTKETLGGKPYTMRLPDKVFHSDKDMSDAVKSKSKYLKEK